MKKTFFWIMLFYSNWGLASGGATAKVQPPPNKVNEGSSELEKINLMSETETSALLLEEALGLEAENSQQSLFIGAGLVELKSLELNVKNQFINYRADKNLMQLSMQYQFAPLQRLEALRLNLGLRYFNHQDYSVEPIRVHFVPVQLGLVYEFKKSAWPLSPFATWDWGEMLLFQRGMEGANASWAKSFQQVGLGFRFSLSEQSLQQSNRAFFVHFKSLYWSQDQKIDLRGSNAEVGMVVNL